MLSALLSYWNSLPGSGRTLAATAAAVSLSLVVLAACFAHPSTAALFGAPLHPEQLSEVEERLAEWNVAFTPTQDNVIVDTRRRNDLLLKLSLAGVPHTHLSSTDEMLSGIGALTPQSVIDAQTLAGRADDIASALRDVSGIQDARVIIAPAKNAEFADESGSTASASVRLRLSPGGVPGRDTIAGIQAFVAASVPGLSSQRVTILDDRGVALSAQEGGGDESVALQNALQSALDAAFGAGTAIVRVHAEYAASAVERHEITHIPIAAGSIDRTASERSYQRGDEHYHEESSQSSHGTQIHEVNSTTAPGALTRLSAAVFVDTSHAGDVLAIRDLAAATIGYDARRGDSLAVQAVDFARTPPTRKDFWWLLYGIVVPLTPTIVCVTGILIALRFAIPSLGNAVQALAERGRIAEASRRAPEMAPAHVRNLLAAEPPHAAAAIISALPAATAAAVLELYPAHERDAIVRRMHRTTSPLILDASEVLRRA